MAARADTSESVVLRIALNEGLQVMDAWQDLEFRGIQILKNPNRFLDRVQGPGFCMICRLF